MSNPGFNINKTTSSLTQMRRLAELGKARGLVSRQDLEQHFGQPLHTVLWIVACKTIEQWEKDARTPEEIDAASKAFDYDDSVVCGFDNFGQWAEAIRCGKCEECLGTAF